MRTNIKKIFAVLLTVALVATMFVMPANATKTYGDFLDDSVVNGDFEVGVEGMVPYGWTFAPAVSNVYLNTNKNANYDDWNFTTQVEEDGNKVAELEKIAAGYVYMHSSPVAVEGGKDYYFSFDYKITSTTVGTAGDAWLKWYRGLLVALRPYDVNGNLLHESGNVYSTDGVSGTDYEVVGSAQTVVTADEYLWRIHTTGQDNADTIGRDGVMDNYERVTFKVTLPASVASVELFLGTGTYKPDYLLTLRFDNVEFATELCNANELFNGDFENLAYYADGGRTSAKTPGPAGWTNVGTNNAGIQILTSYVANYKAMIAKEYDANGKVTNNYAEFSLIDAYQNNTSAAPGYVLFKSNKMAIPAVAGKTITVSFKYKARAFDPEDAFSVSTSYSPSMRVNFYTAEDVHIGTAAGRFTKIVGEVADWTEYTITATVPADSCNAAYYTVDFYQGHQKGNDVNAVYCFDDITITYPELTEAERNNLYGFEEQSVNTSGWAVESDYSSNFTLDLVNDSNRSNVYMITGSDNSRSGSRKGSVGYIIGWTSEKIAVTEGTKLSIAFDVKADGIEEAYAYNKQWCADPTLNTNNTQEATQFGGEAQIRFRYFDANGDVFYALANGTILTESGKIASVAAGYGYGQTTDVDWTHCFRNGTVTVPAGAVYIQYGFMMYGYNTPGGSLVEHYFDNIIVKPQDDEYWKSAEYNLVSSGEINETNLFDKLMLSNGDANFDGVADLVDLVRMNNTLTALEGKYTPYESSEEAAYDMNQDGRITPEDITLLRWKLLGITDEASAVK